jgi:putative ABC transport system permease protein
MEVKPCHIPAFALRLLRWFCPDHQLEEIEGDLIQQFERDVSTFGEGKARKRFVWNAIRFFRPGIILRNKFTLGLNPFHMCRHFLKVFLRSTVRNGGYSFINLSGLTVGLAATILILLWVIDEISFDNFHHDSDRIFQVMAHHAFDEGTATYPGTPGPLAEALKELPEVEHAFHTTFRGPALFHYGEQSIFEEGIYSDEDIFSVLNFPILQGNARKPFPDNNSIAISKSLAIKYFRGENAIGKVFTIDNKFEAKVSSVFEDIPQNSSIQFDFVLPYSIYAKSDPYNEEWGAWTGGATYVKLHKGSDRAVVAGKITSSFTKPKIWVRWDDNVELFLFPLTEWRLFGNFENGKQAGGRIAYVRGFSLAAMFILMIACINFMNLATARSITRSREVAVRKVVGASRRSLMGQFMGESILISFISLSLALIVVHLTLPNFNDLTGKKIGIDYTNPFIPAGLIGVTLITGLIAGSYPAFFLSSLKTLNILKGKFSGLAGADVRKVLVVFQFSLSIIMIICAMVVEKQIRFMRDKNLGFDKENVFYFDTGQTLGKNFDGFRNDALQDPSIEFVARGNSNPMDVFNEIVLSDDAWPGKTKKADISFKWIQCDYDFLPALGFTLVAGRGFSRDFPADSNNYIITEEAARRMNLSNPVGQSLASPQKGQIIGVVKDFHSAGLQSPIAPAIIAMRPENTNRIFVRYKAGNAEASLHGIEALGKKYNGGYPMAYTFLDETFDRQYRNEIMIGRLARYFTLMTIFISCLGMFALASFMAAKRTKEIGIRKVMGANAWQMVVLLCREFILLVVIALAAGIPLGWIGMNKFLSGYAFHTQIGISVFALTIVLMFATTLITVSLQAVKAALEDPVKSLRSE